MPNYLSQYLTEEEYRCPCCGKLPPFLEGNNWQDFPILVELFESFDMLRGQWGRPIHVNSGYRCPVHNLAIGGSYLSCHMFGCALDPDFDDEPEVLEAYAKLKTINPDLRMGIYTETGSFIHFDNGYHIHPMASEHWVKEKRWYR